MKISKQTETWGVTSPQTPPQAGGKTQTYYGYSWAPKAQQAHKRAPTTKPQQGADTKMKLIAFSVYDEKAECFGHPFFLSAVGLATRLFSDWCNNPNTPTGKHPNDFKLYQVGHWMDDQAKFDTLDVPIFIGNGADYVEKEQK